MLRVLLTLFFAAIVCVGEGRAAAASNPSLVADNPFEEEDREKVQLQLEKLDLVVTLLGDHAETVATMVFHNPTDEDLEAELSFQMPQNSIISGYALDLEGVMVDGVIVEKEKARKTYEAIVRQQVDPGLVELTSANTFRITVYPVFSDDKRTIRVKFITELEPDRSYHLPLQSLNPVSQVKLKIVDLDVGRRMRIAKSTGVRMRSRRVGDTWVAEGERNDLVLRGGLIIRVSDGSAKSLIATDLEGNEWFSLSGQLPPTSKLPVQDVEDVIIFWDKSLSRSFTSQEKELDFLESYLEEVSPSSVRVVLFSGQATELIFLDKKPTRADILDTLRRVQYDGPSNFEASLSRNPSVRQLAWSADHCLLFSDGQRTLGDRSVSPPKCRLFTISSGGNSDTDYLRFLAYQADGEHLDLNFVSVHEALSRILNPGWKTKMSVAELLRSGLSVQLQSDGRFSIIGRHSVNRTGILNFVAHDGREYQQSLATDDAIRVRSNVYLALYGRDLISQLSEAGASFEEILAAGQRYGVMIPKTSFLVLEDIEQYVQAGIVPPANFPGLDMQSFWQGLGDMQANAVEERMEHLEFVSSQWQERKDWWAKKRPKSAKGAVDELQSPRSEESERREPSVGVGGDVDEIIISEESMREARDEAAVLREVPSLSDGSSASQERALAKIELRPWSPDRPYLDALKGLEGEEFENAYFEQRRIWGRLPGFYFDTANYLFNHGRIDRAIAMVLNVLELDTSNEETRVILASRLRQYGDYDTALNIYRSLMKSSSHRPQPARSYALTLVEAMEALDTSGSEQTIVVEGLKEALTSLNAVAMELWGDDYHGIEVIALMEANRLKTDLERRGVETEVIDPRFVALLDTDIRVVLEWNTPATDMDLWVLEPEGTKVYYGKPRSNAGGHLSKDMTQGYGPEEYFIRLANKGEYQVFADHFRADAIRPNGANSVAVSLCRDYGRKNESCQVLHFELSKKESNVPVGKISF